MISSLCSFLLPPIISSFLGPTILISPRSQTFLAYVLPYVWDTKFQANTKIPTL
jgi:hypothetical protein